MAGDEEAQPLLLTPAEVVRLLDLDARDLARMRERGEGPSYNRLGGRLIRYDAASTRKWNAAQERS
jgi:hypothetical protein